MKNQMFALIGLGLLLATASAYAQTGVVKANVPFNFIVNKAQLPAGEYRIHSLGVTGSAMTIQSPDGNVIHAFLPNACSSPQVQKTTKLIFHRYGSRNFLPQIQSGDGHARELFESQLEKKLSHSQAMNEIALLTHVPAERR